MVRRNDKTVLHPPRPAAGRRVDPVRPHRHHLDDLDAEPAGDDPVHLPHARHAGAPPSDPALCAGAVRHVLRDRGIFAVLIEGAGAGDLVNRLRPRLGATPVAAIAGPGTDDAAAGAQVRLARVAGALDACSVEAAMEELDLPPASLLLVMSAGATPDLGHDLRVETAFVNQDSAPALAHRLMLGLAGKAR